MEGIEPGFWRFLVAAVYDCRLLSIKWESGGSPRPDGSSKPTGALALLTIQKGYSEGG